MLKNKVCALHKVPNHYLIKKNCAPNYSIGCVKCTHSDDIITINKLTDIKQQAKNGQKTLEDFSYETAVKLFLEEYTFVIEQIKKQLKREYKQADRRHSALIESLKKIREEDIHTLSTHGDIFEEIKETSSNYMQSYKSIQKKKSQSRDLYKTVLLNLRLLKKSLEQQTFEDFKFLQAHDIPKWSNDDRQNKILAMISLKESQDKSTIAQLRSVVQTKDRHIDKLRQEISNLQGHLGQRINEVSLWKKEQKEFVLELQKYQRITQELKTQIEQKREFIVIKENEVEAEKEKALKVLDKLDQKLKQTKESLKTEKQKTKVLEQNIRQNQILCQNRQQKIEQLQTKSRADAEKILELENELSRVSELEETIQEMKLKEQRMKQLIEISDFNNKSKQEKILKLEITIEQVRLELKEKDKVQKLFEQEFSQQKNDKLLANARYNETKEQMTQLLSKFKSLEQQNINNLKAIEQLQQRTLKQAMLEIEALQQKCQFYERKVQQLRDTVQQLKKQKDEQIQNLNESINNLNHLVQSYRGRENYYVEQNKNLSMKLQSDGLEIKKYEIKQTAIAKDLKQKVSEIESLRTQLLLCRDHNVELENTIAQVLKQKSDFQQQTSQLRSKHQEDKLKDLKEHMELQKNYNEVKEILISLDKEMRELRQKYERQIQELEILKEQNEELKKSYIDIGVQLQFKLGQNLKLTQNNQNLSRSLTQIQVQCQQLRKQYQDFMQKTIKKELYLRTFWSSRILKELQTQSLIQTFRERDKSIKTAELIYRFEEFNQNQFHEYCDQVDNILLIALAENQTIFGGFSEKSIEYYQKNTHTDKQLAFLYCFSQQHIILFPIKNNGKKPVTCDKAYGPIFGEAEIRIRNTNKSCFSNLGVSLGNYANPLEISAAELKTLFGGKQQFTIQHYEIYRLEFEQ